MPLAELLPSGFGKPASLASSDHTTLGMLFIGCRVRVRRKPL